MQTLIIIGAIAVVAIVLGVPSIRQKFFSLLRIGADKGYNGATTEADREKDKMNQAVAAETRQYNTAKAQLVAATGEVQTVLGQANTQKRKLQEADDAVRKAQKDVQDAQALKLSGDDLNKYIDALTEAKGAYDTQAKLAQAAVTAATNAGKRLETATAAVQKFAKQIEADKGSTALASALNLTTSISRTTADLTSTLSAASEAHNSVQEALDRAQAGADMTAPPVDPLAEARKKAEREKTLAELNGTGAPAATPPATDGTK